MCASNPDNVKLLKEIDLLFMEYKNATADPLIKDNKLRNASVVAKKRYENLHYNTFDLAQGKIKIDAITGYLKILENNELGHKNDLINQTRASHKYTKILGIVLTATAILAGLITTIILGQTIQKRIISLKNLAFNLSNENFDVKMEETNQDELSSLATDMHNMAQKLEISFSRLHKMNQELDQFAYVVSHDLKAPLRAINNLAEWIEEDIGTTTPEIKSNLNLMRGRVQRMENLINGILDYARVGRRKLEKNTFTIKTLLDEITESLEVPPGFTINFPDTDINITTEKILLHQVLANLIGNAIKYNDKAAGLVRVQVTLHKEHFIFSISDNGPGIPQKYHEKIFGVFQTIEARDTRESTGIGLAIVKKIVEEQDGSIWLESEFTGGATFYFTWPYKSLTSST